MKLVVALALWVAALGMVLVFAQDESGAPASAVLRPVAPDQRRPSGAAQSCVDESRNGSSVRFCTSTVRVRPLQTVAVDVVNRLAERCGPAVVDFGDRQRSRPLERGPSRVQHAYDRAGSFTIRVVSEACPPSDGLRVTVTP